MGVSVAVGLAAGNLFNPRVLFAAGEAGAFYDPSDLSSMYQDSAGTTAAAVDSPVGRILDKSGRGNHAVQATAAARPMLRRDSSGKLCLETDGVDDWLRASFAIAQPFDRISAIRQISWTSNDRIFDGITAGSGRLYQASATPQLYLTGGVVGTSSLAIGATGVVSERHNGASSHLAVNNGAAVTGDAGIVAPDGIDIGATAGAAAGNFRLYGVVMIGRALTEAETIQLRRFMAAKSGVKL